MCTDRASITNFAVGESADSPDVTRREARDRWTLKVITLSIGEACSEMACLRECPNDFNKDMSRQD